MSDQERTGFNRRAFLRRAAATTAAAAWATPIIQTVAATPAFAQTNGTPRVGCFHSPDEDHPNPDQSCMDACTSVAGCTGALCDGLGQDPGDGPCGKFCTISPGNQCCNAELCDPTKFSCPTGAEAAIYSGSLVGC